LNELSSALYNALGGPDSEVAAVQQKAKKNGGAAAA
jgi:hypothetical protein